MDDIQEEKAIADQISEAISRPGQDMFEDVRPVHETQLYSLIHGSDYFNRMNSWKSCKSWKN